MTHHFYFKRGARAEVLCGAVPQTQLHLLSLLLSHGLAVNMGNRCSPPCSFADVQLGLGHFVPFHPGLSGSFWRIFAVPLASSLAVPPLTCSCCFLPSFHSLPIMITLHLSTSSCFFHLPVHLAKKIPIPFLSDQVASTAFHTSLSFELILLMLK